MKDTAQSTWIGDASTAPIDNLALVSIVGVQNVAGDATNTVNSTQYTLGNPLTGETYTSNAIQMSTPGITSLPLGPGTVTQSSTLQPSFDASNVSQNFANTVAFVRDDQWIILGTRDTRTQFLGGNLAAGETAVYANGSAARTIYKNDGSITHYTQSTSNGIDGYGGILAGQGVYEQITPTSWSIITPWGNIIFDQSGFHINHISGAGFNLGSPPAGIPFASLLGNFCNITAATTTIGSSIINLGNVTQGPVYLNSTMPLTITSLTSLTFGALNINLGIPTDPSVITLNATIAAITSLNGSITLNAPTIALTGAVGITGALVVSALATLQGALNVTGAVTFEGAAEIVGVLSSPLVPAPGVVDLFIFPA